MKRVVAGLLLAGALIFPNAVFAQGPTVDVSGIDVASLKLYMGGQEAVDALKAKFGKPVLVNNSGLQANAIRVSTINSKINPGKTWINNISYNDGEYEYGALFVESVKQGDIRPEAIYCIYVHANPQFTPAQNKQMEESLNQKFGSPTFTVKSMDYSIDWCGQIQGNFRCDPAKPHASWSRVNLTKSYQLNLIDESFLKNAVQNYKGQKPNL